MRNLIHVSQGVDLSCNDNIATYIGYRQPLLCINMEVIDSLMYSYAWFCVKRAIMKKYPMEFDT